MSEPNQITCPRCGQNYGVQPEQWPQYVGRAIPCTHCGMTFAVSAPGVAAASPPPVASYQAAAGYGAYAGPPAKASGFAIASLVMGLSVLMYEPLANHRSDGSNFLFGDGQVEFVPRVKATKMLVELQSGTNPPPAFSHF